MFDVVVYVLMLAANSCVVDMEFLVWFIAVITLGMREKLIGNVTDCPLLEKSGALITPHCLSAYGYVHSFVDIPAVVCTKRHGWCRVWVDVGGAFVALRLFYRGANNLIDRAKGNRKWGWIGAWATAADARVLGNSPLLHTNRKPQFIATVFAPITKRLSVFYLICGILIVAIVVG